MHVSPNGVRLSATDLSHFLACRHLTALDLAAALERRPRPAKKDDPLLDLLRKRGEEHERAYVDTLRAEGRDVVTIPRGKPDDAVAQTLDAIRGGADVIVQAALRHESWFGYADVLLRHDAPSANLGWSYEVIDTKLARETRAGTVLQLGLYSAMLATVQGSVPEQFRVVVPGRDGVQRVEHPFRVDDYAAYLRLMQRQLRQAATMDPDALAAAHYPEPVEHCSLCTWWRACDEQWRADDHLSLVAGLGRLHRRELEAQDIDTLARLAEMPLPMSFTPRRGSRETYERARHQALVQLQSRTRATPVYELRPPEAPKEGVIAEPRGLARLPEPSPGDVFLDLEGDQFADDGGREYLFGMTTVDPDGSARYHSWWAFTAHEERLAFESAMDFIMDRLARFPDMHVYHFAPYEPTAFRKLMGRHATREQELDRLLRGRRFIDLFAVVRQSMWAGVESYSIKRLEPLNGYRRDVDLPDANGALRRMEYALQLRRPDLVVDPDRDVIAGYNRDDCVSTLRLRDWLETVRVEADSQGIPCPRPPLEPDEAPEQVGEREQLVRDLRARLLAGVPEGREDRDDEQQARWMLAYMLDYHRREDKATWWEYFRLRDLPEEDLLEEREAVAGLDYVKRVDAGGFFKNGNPKGPVVDRYSFPEQEMEIDPGAKLNSASVRDWGKVVSVDRLQRTIDIEKSRKKAEIHATAVFVFDHVPAREAEASLFRLGESVADAGSINALPRSAAAELLLAHAPRLHGGTFEARVGESVTDFAVRCGLQLDRSVLAIQGPPGAGKTHTGAEMICALVAEGKKVGVTATSHKVIRNLLDKCVERAAENHVTLRVAHKDGAAPDEEGSVHDGVRSVDTNPKALEALASGEVAVLGGTSWLWARPEFADAVDVLFVDEAGQMALANVLAVAQCAKSIVLLGDPQQLDQPQKGSHPDGVAVPALKHLLGEHQTMPADRGIFLPTTWRMSPALCRFTSELYYERRLESRPGLERQQLVNVGHLDGSSLWVVDVNHDGNRNHSPEEVEAVAALVGRLTARGARWAREDGSNGQLGLEDILVVSPYNAQVNRLAERLGGQARVGTVDKFQGQEAPVVIYSMATSRPEDAPRGMEFLYSPNRLNVATSRARCAVILVASPHLFEPECRSVRQIRLANGLCLFREMARELRVTS